MSRIYGRCCALFVFRVLTRFALYIGEIARTLEEVSPRATSANLRLAPLRWREKRSKRKKQPSLTSCFRFFSLRICVAASSAHSCCCDGFRSSRARVSLTEFSLTLPLLVRVFARKHIVAFTALMAAVLTAWIDSIVPNPQLGCILCIPMGCNH